MMLVSKDGNPVDVDWCHYCKDYRFHEGSVCMEAFHKEQRIKFNKEHIGIFSLKDKLYLCNQINELAIEVWDRLASFKWSKKN